MIADGSDFFRWHWPVVSCGLSVVPVTKWDTALSITRTFGPFMFQSFDATVFRPDLGVRLTEAIQKRIDERTPYKVSSDPNADSVMEVRLTTDSKRVVTENPNG